MSQVVVSERMLKLADELRKEYIRANGARQVGMLTASTGCPSCDEQRRALAARSPGDSTWIAARPGHTCELEVVLLRVEENGIGGPHVEALFETRNIMNDCGEEHDFTNWTSQDKSRCSFCGKTEGEHPCLKFERKTREYAGKLAVTDFSGRVVVTTQNLDYSHFRMLVRVRSWEEGCKMMELANLIYEAVLPKHKAAHEALLAGVK